jgi:glycosyltransferase involved in cell wall biosynthesis
MQIAMNRVHILTPSTVTGDAISHDVLGMRRWFRRRGLPTTIYTGSWSEDLQQLVRPLSAYCRHLAAADDLLIYHHSVGWPEGLALYRRSRNRKVVKYHNVTRPVFFEPYNENYVRTCRRGQKETRWLARSGAKLYLSDSDFNSWDLIAAGAPPAACRTVPPFHRIGRLDALALDGALAEELRRQPALLFAGRVSPNKGHLHLIRMLAYYHHYLGGRAHLYLVGSIDSGLKRYNDQLQDEIRRLRLQEWVHLTGKVDDRQLRTYYACATAFVCASEHEGFCVPLAEAMYYGIPIIAYGGSAVAGTLGEAALVWETPSPALFAESIQRLVESAELRTRLEQAQRQRYAAQFTCRAIGRQLAAALALVFGVDTPSREFAFGSPIG